MLAFGSCSTGRITLRNRCVTQKKFGWNDCCRSAKTLLGSGRSRIGTASRMTTADEKLRTHTPHGGPAEARVAGHSEHLVAGSGVVGNQHRRDLPVGGSCF